MKSVLNHIAILVESIESVIEKGQFSSSHLGEIEEFPSEGTREIYIGTGNQMGRLLLMQPIGDGPYKKALNKRGQGLHHIALDVQNIDKFVTSLTGSGWLLHPNSLEFYKGQKQVYLCRPSVPVLIEVQERKSLTNEDYFIEKLEFSFGEERLLESLVCEQLKMGTEINLRVDGKILKVKDLLN